MNSHIDIENFHLKSFLKNSKSGHSVITENENFISQEFLVDLLDRYIYISISISIYIYPEIAEIGHVSLSYWFFSPENSD